MTYATKSPTSDVHVYATGPDPRRPDDWRCGDCTLPLPPRKRHDHIVVEDGARVFTRRSRMIEHLEEHDAAGHKVPAEVIARLEAERECQHPNVTRTYVSGHGRNTLHTRHCPDCGYSEQEGWEP